MLALDYGRRRIGVAVSDPTGTIATPRGVVERPKSDRTSARPPEALLDVIRETEPSAILLGIPLAMDGSAGPMAAEVRGFAEALYAATEIPIVEWDERLTTARAEREIRSMDLPRSKRSQKGRADEMAATLMLTTYLRSLAVDG
ncbi:MAG: Holliday junction resolvase RuvX [Gemmatimonadetes bacterium]|nr:Holliday junction resolvase RuvX [Gemmatimonadota bacterium]